MSAVWQRYVIVLSIQKGKMKSLLLMEAICIL